jgi:hypothetical protein
MCTHRVSVFIAVVLGIVGISAQGAERARVIRAGIIGVDTSHALAFTQVMNNPKATGPLADVDIVAVYPDGVKDNPSSWDRIPKNTELFRKLGIEVCPSVENLLGKVDAVLIECVDGRPHLEYARKVIAAKKPLFIDKPMAASLADVLEIFRLANEAGVPVFSASSLRYSPELQAEIHDPKLGRILGCDAYSPCSLEEHHPDFFWYGIHGVETLFTAMGSGCQSVSRITTEGTDVAVGVWKDGRIGTFRGTRQVPHSYGATIFGEKKIVTFSKYGGYEPLVVEICKFFKTGKPPVAAEDTVEIFAFMEAADQSKRQGGCPVSIQSVLKK